MSGGGGSKWITSGYRYYFGILMGLGRGPVNSIEEITIGDKRAWIGSVQSNSTITIDAPNLFGGEDKEGGVSGPLDVLMGASDQVVTGGYPAMRPGPIPGLRGTLSVFFNGMVCAMNPYPKPWKFRVRRTTMGWDGAVWYPEKAKIEIPNEVPADYSHIHAMNPAHIIYECYTNRQWGRGLSSSAIDDASFRQCADRLYAEGFGLCLRWSRKDSIKNFVKSVIDHIGASIFQSPRTGLITMRLIRGEYDVNTLPLFTTESGIKSIDSYEVSAINNSVNAVEVKYHCPVTNEDRTITVGNSAARISSGGAVNLMSKAYPGIPVGSIASRVAQRELRAASTTIRRFEITFDRRGYFIEPGSVILIEDRTRGITRTAVRVGKIDVSNYRDGSIKVSALQDIFSMPEKSFTTPVPPTWEPPSTRPCVSDQKVFEMPYFMLVRGMSAADLAYTSDDTGFIATLARSGPGVNAGYSIAVRQSAPTPDDDPTSTDYFCN